MQNFKVTVNGKVYDVSVQEAGQNIGTPVATAPVAAPVAAPAPAQEAAPAPAAAPVVKSAGAIEAGDVPLNAPLAGTIMAIKVKPGDAVKYGQVILTLEALKMENEIVAPQDGVIKEITAVVGATVNVGDVLAILK